jgi:predicted RND superfamily exporter protein
LKNKSSWGRRYLEFLDKYRWPLYIFFALSIIVSLLTARNLQLKTDFATLLPDNLPSVKNVRKLEQRIGNTGLLVIGVVSPSFSANKRFVEDMVKLLKPHTEVELRYIDYKYDQVEDFIYRFGLTYLPKNKLQKIHDEISSRVEKKKDEAFSSFLGLEENTKPAQTSINRGSMRDFAKGMLDPSMSKFLDYREAYLSAEDGRVMAIAIRPASQLKSLKDATRLVNLVEGYIRLLGPAHYDPEMQTSLSGNIKQSVEEYETLKKDLLDTNILLTSLILSVLFLFFWSFSILGLLAVCLASAVTYTFALTFLQIGYLNSQTAFLGSIVVGTGINYAVIYLARVIEYIREKKTHFEAVYLAVENTAVATVIASSTTAVSFLALFLADNKGLSQFAFIGGIGVTFCWIMSFTYLPLWTYRFLKNGWMRVDRHPFSHAVGNYTMSFKSFILDRPWIVGSILVFFTVFASFGVVKLYKDPMEYNFDKVRNRNVLTPEVQALRKRVHQVFSVNLNPSLIMADTLEDAKQICPSFYRLKATMPPESNMLEECLSLYYYLPKETYIDGERLALMKRLQRLFSSKLVQESEYGGHFRRFSQKMEFRPPAFKDMPEQMLQRFRENDGKLGLFAYVYPNSKKPINDGHNLLAFTYPLREFHLQESKSVLSAAGNSFVFADLLEGMQREAPIISLVALIGVLAITFLLSGGWKSALFMGSCLLLGVWWMLGLQGFFEIKYNFFNFIALPITFGIGIDYPTNVFVRCQQEGYKNLHRVIRHSGTAVILCCTTTMIGYYSLIGSVSQALDSFARIALFGEISCLFIAIFVTPWAVQLIKGRKVSKR